LIIGRRETGEGEREDEEDRVELVEEFEREALRGLRGRFSFSSDFFGTVSSIFFGETADSVAEELIGAVEGEGTGTGMGVGAGGGVAVLLK
jgi:hypothetical protein